MDYKGMNWFLVDDLPEEFGEAGIFAAFESKMLAQLNLNIMRGFLSGDSYQFQYLKLMNRKQCEKYGFLEKEGRKERRNEI